MVQAFLVVLGYAAVSQFWTPDKAHGFRDLVSLAMALATGIAVLLLVRDDRRASASLVAGIALSFGLQVIIAILEIRTGFHLSHGFAASYIESYRLPNVEALVGPVAWGTLGNPNDLGGYFLLSISLLSSARAYGPAMGRVRLLLTSAVVCGAMAVGLTSLADARALRLGIAVLVAIHMLDRLLPPGGNLRVSLMIMLVVFAVGAFALWGGGIADIVSGSQSDAARLALISEGLADSVGSAGFGLGLGAETALIDSGRLATNFHSVVAQLAAELGLIVAGLFVVYVVGLLVSWALVTRSARCIGREASLARAALAASLLIYGFAGSGVLGAPHYWGFFSLTVLVASDQRRGR
jgi:hypothetical protein